MGSSFPPPPPAWNTTVENNYAPMPSTTLEAGYAENGNGNAITIYVTQRTWQIKPQL